MIVARDTYGKTWWLIRFQRGGEVLATKCAISSAVALPASLFTDRDRQRLRESYTETEPVHTHARRVA